MEEPQTLVLYEIFGFWFTVYVTVLELVRPKSRAFDDVPPDERDTLWCYLQLLIRSKRAQHTSSVGL
jgi:hypothetical protein